MGAHRGVELGIEGSSGCVDVTTAQADGGTCSLTKTLPGLAGDTRRPMSFTATLAATPTRAIDVASNGVSTSAITRAPTLSSGISTVDPPLGAYAIGAIQHLAVHFVHFDSAFVDVAP